ncbi:starch synthase 3, chloroplastic/amyloplastic-like [Zingiber officinale]|uniref:starch synthase 3, chloroplastic/amyloplastic-like n=1 Tax=Zingiber officinale TaxID=94328 RepID=UPI001C4B04D0|nr:starch synthase 3, chloroplastic/amyloplastic-like [Zingiber officinale]
MAMSLQPQWALSCQITTSANTRVRVMPVLGLFSRSSLRYQEVRIKFIPCALASSDYSKRHPKRILIPKTKASSTPRGFAPIARPLVGTSTQKRDQNDTEDKEPSHTPSSTLTDKIFTRDSQAADKNFSGIPFTATIDTECDVPIVRSGNEEHGQGLGTQYVKVDHSDKIIENGEKIGQFNEVERHVALGNDQIGGISISEKTSIADQQEEKPSNRENNSGKDDTDSGDSLLKHREEFDALKQRKQLEDLANENFSRGNKIFVTPEVVTQDQVIKVFLNQNLSVLATETEILIKGAYNGWKWKFFTEKLQKTNLIGDWWACELYVPKEAYRVDFVFFNGADVYENNDYKDFSISVEGDMDETKFEEFLLEEKKKELERLAAEENEKKRLAEEQRQREAEKAAIESDRLQAKTQVEKRRQGLHHVMKLASQSAHHVWQMEPSLFEGGDRIKLYYNRSSRPLAHASEIWVHGGHNNWSEGLSIVRELSRSEKVDGDWWCVDVVVPDQAVVLDWVFANGPPGKAVCYDNNNLNDFHATVSKGMPDELFWVEEEQRIFRKLQEDRRKKAEKIERVKAETKERTMKMFLLSHKHIVYTEPVDVQAGKMVSIFYNPSNTVLNGKPEVWFRCSFNRWSHPKGPLPPQKMVLAENGSHHKITVKVPIDAYMMDFVFSEKEDGGLYDNRNKMDYHIPVTGSITKEPPMHIIHISVEMAPIAKVGGLGDVVTSLSRAVQDLGHKVDVILPNYNCMNLNNVKDFHYHSTFSWGGAEIKVMFGKVEGLSVYFLEPQNGMFSVGCIYGRNDDGNRFGFFCHAALEFLLQSGFQPDILHCHDWSSAPVAWLFKEHYIHNGLSNSQVVFTIHNLEFGIQNIARAMMFADKATTVSQTYSREISGNSAISPHLDKFHGIVNGIDPDIWDPCNDQFIPVSYTSENVMEGKRAAKDALQQRLGLKRSDLPLVGIITRLTVQKGIHLIKHAVWRTLEQNGQVVLLGSAPDPRIQNDFVNLGNQLHNSHADRARFCLTYDEPLSHLIYAGADFILVPSIFEPCGLTQLIAMRYGSVPIVRKTGGLYDTVFDVDNDKERAQAQGLEPNGFSFEGTDAGAMDSALNRAFPAWSNAREWFYSLCKRVMEQDWSWNRPALDYMELYHSTRS